MDRNRADALIARVDPSFRQRWTIYDGILERLTGPESRWLDAGCGENIAIEEFPCALNVGLDIHRHPSANTRPPCHFVTGSLEKLPFGDASFTLVTLNMVVEHLPAPETVFAEIGRVLQPGGRLLVHTTNLHSPLIMAGKLLPAVVRNRLFTGLLGAREEDVFPAHHRINTAARLTSVDGFAVEELHHVQDINRTNPVVFSCLLAYHLLTRLPGLARFRSNLIVLLRKT